MQARTPKALIFHRVQNLHLSSHIHKRNLKQTGTHTHAHRTFSWRFYSQHFFQLFKNCKRWKSSFVNPYILHISHPFVDRNLFLSLNGIPGTLSDTKQKKKDLVFAILRKSSVLSIFIVVVSYHIIGNLLKSCKKNEEEIHIL